jgi:hypothetical protein
MAGRGQAERIPEVLDPGVKRGQVAQVALEAHEPGCRQGRQAARLSGMTVRRAVHDLLPCLDGLIDPGKVSVALSQPHQG